MARQIFYPPMNTFPHEPGMTRLQDNMSALYLDAGIVTPPRTPPLPDPVSNTLAAYSIPGLQSSPRPR